MKRILPLFLSLLLILTLAGCGGSSKPSSAAPGEYYDAKNVEGYESPQSADQTSGQPTDRSKMIFRAYIDLETLEFDAAVDTIADLVKDSGGYFQEQEVATYSSGYRYARMVIRVPTERFSDFCGQVGNVCHTVRLNTTQENISESYYDVESRLNIARTKLARLQELLSMADTMADIITIESTIADTEQTIDYLSGTLRGYDNLVDYATVSIDLDEVYRFTGTGEAPLTLGQRLGEAFSSGLHSIGDFFEGLLLFLAYAWFWLLLAAAAVVVVVRLVRGRKLRRRKKHASQSDAGQSEQ
jgi:hypothetical protein